MENTTTEKRETVNTQPKDLKRTEDLYFKIIEENEIKYIKLKRGLTVVSKCDWCKTKPSVYTINEGDERVCDDCYHESVHCDRCGLEIHGDDCIEGLCMYCYSDLYD